MSSRESCPRTSISLRSWASDAEDFHAAYFSLRRKTHDRGMSTLRVFEAAETGSRMEAGRERDARHRASVGEWRTRARTRAKRRSSRRCTGLAVGKVRTSLGVLLFAVGCTLLIACAQPGQSFSRTHQRTPEEEIAIRKALRAAARRSDTPVDDGKFSRSARRGTARLGAGVVAGDRVCGGPCLRFRAISKCRATGRSLSGTPVLPVPHRSLAMR